MSSHCVRFAFVPGLVLSALFVFVVDSAPRRHRDLVLFGPRFVLGRVPFVSFCFFLGPGRVLRHDLTAV